MQHKYSSYLQISSSANKTVFTLYSMHSTSHYSQDNLLVFTFALNHGHISRTASVLSAGWYSARWLLPLLVPRTTLVHEPATCGGVTCAEPTHWDSSACWGLTPPSPNWQMITRRSVPWPPSSAVLSASAVIVRVMGPTRWCGLIKGGLFSPTFKAWNI